MMIAVTVMNITVALAADMPAIFMTQMAFHRSEIGLSAASATVMFMTVTAIVIPYLYSELRRQDVGR